VGASWWPPAVALATTLLVGLLGRLLPGWLRHPLAAAGVAGLVALAPELSVGAWLVLTAYIRWAHARKTRSDTPRVGTDVGECGGCDRRRRRGRRTASEAPGARAC
jgi:hypothetical protein